MPCCGGQSKSQSRQPASQASGPPAAGPLAYPARQHRWDGHVRKGHEPPALGAPSDQEAAALVLELGKLRGQGCAGQQDAANMNMHCCACAPKEGASGTCSEGLHSQGWHMATCLEQPKTCWFVHAVLRKAPTQAKPCCAALQGSRGLASPPRPAPTPANSQPTPPARPTPAVQLPDTTNPTHHTHTHHTHRAPTLPPAAAWPLPPRSTRASPAAPRCRSPPQTGCPGRGRPSW